MLSISKRIEAFRELRYLVIVCHALKIGIDIIRNFNGS